MIEVTGCDLLPPLDQTAAGGDKGLSVEADDVAPILPRSRPERGSRPPAEDTLFDPRSVASLTNDGTANRLIWSLFALDGIVIDPT